MRQHLLGDAKELFSKLMILFTCSHVLRPEFEGFAKDCVHDGGDCPDIGPGATDWEERAVDGL